jgi:hypothetical protein
MTTGLEGASLATKGTCIGTVPKNGENAVPKNGENGEMAIGGPLSNRALWSKRKPFCTPNLRAMMCGATTLPRIDGGTRTIDGRGACMGDTNGRPATPIPLASRAKAGTLVPVPKKISMAITGNQRIRSLIAQPLGKLPFETIWPTLMSEPDLGNMSALSIADSVHDDHRLCFPR